MPLLVMTPTLTLHRRLQPKYSIVGSLCAVDDYIMVALLAMRFKTQQRPGGGKEWQAINSLGGFRNVQVGIVVLGVQQ